jgi:hypothetical protein
MVAIAAPAAVMLRTDLVGTVAPVAGPKIVAGVMDEALAVSTPAAAAGHCCDASSSACGGT